MEVVLYVLLTPVWINPVHALICKVSFGPEIRCYKQRLTISYRLSYETYTYSFRKLKLVKTGYIRIIGLSEISIKPVIQVAYRIYDSKNVYISLFISNDSIKRSQSLPSPSPVQPH